jgi:hypothetical protein
MRLPYRAKIFSRANGFRLTAGSLSSEPSQIVSETADVNIVKLSLLTKSVASSLSSVGLKRSSLF